MLIQDPYNTKVLSSINKDKYLPPIERYLITDWSYLEKKAKETKAPFKTDSSVLNPVYLYGISKTEQDIPPFAHPIINTARNYIACDLRQVVKPISHSSDYTIKNESEYKHFVTRFVLTGLFIEPNYKDLLSLKFAQKAFATWLSDNLTRKFGLNPGESVKLSILSHLYYLQCFTNNPIQHNPQELFIKTRWDIIVPELIHEVINKLDKLDNIDDYCKSLYKVTDNPRLKDMDYIVLSNILVNTWFGLNSKELVLCALEHPPTWIALVYTALNQKSYKNSGIAQIVEKINKKNKGDEFNNQVDHLLKTY